MIRKETLHENDNKLRLVKVLHKGIQKAYRKLLDSSQSDIFKIETD